MRILALTRPDRRPGRRRWVSGATAVAVAVTALASSCTVVPSAAPLISAVCNGTWVLDAAGQVTDPSLNEVSGVVASRAHPGVLWVHNDSGHPAQFFAVSMSGTVLATFDVSGASAVDWEDIALGPGPQPGITYLYLADIGDNAEARSSVKIYRVPEPYVDPTAAPIGSQSATAETLTFTYPDRPHNAETLLVDTDGALVVVTKQAESGSVFQAPPNLPAGSTTSFTGAGTVPLPGSGYLTGGDIAPAGDAVLLRTYGQVLAWTRPAGTSIGDTLAGSRCERALYAEPQGEAIGFLPDSRGFVTMSEGVNQYVGRYRAP